MYLIFGHLDPWEHGSYKTRVENHSCYDLLGAVRSPKLQLAQSRSYVYTLGPKVRSDPHVLPHSQKRQVLFLPRLPVFRAFGDVRSRDAFLAKTRPVACSEHLGAVERFLSRASTGAEKQVEGSSLALKPKMANWGTMVLVGTSTVFRLQGLTVPASPIDELLPADRKDQTQARPSGTLCRREKHAAG